MLRFVGAVLITSGVLLFADAGITVAWQEPISALLAQRDQSRLGHQLDAARLLVRREALGIRRGDARSRLAHLAAIEARRAHRGAPLGRIELPSLHRSYVFVQGTDTATLRQGPGHYPETTFPGQGGTVAIAGHRTTYLAPFRTIDSLKPGSPIVLMMTYWRFTYRVLRTQVVDPDAFSIVRNVPGEERLVLSACHPLYSASHRIVAFARLASESPVF
ncbi:MAG: class E sortase [Thermoleophilaceae bacterium]